MQSAADYKQENDAARLTASEPIAGTIKTFTIGLGDVKGASATLNFLWDKTRVPVKLHRRCRGGRQATRCGR